MKKLSPISLLIFVFSITILTACGGGGGGSTPPFQPTTAVLTLSTTATGPIPGTTTINGYDVTINLPAGVTVKSAATTGPAATAGATIISAGTTGKVRILVASASGFKAGNFSTVNCDIASGSYPKATDFPQPTFNVSPNPPGGGGASGWDNNTSSTVNLTNNLSLTGTAVVN